MIKATIRINALKSMVERKAPKILGICQDNIENVFPIIPADIQIYAIIQFTVETPTNGMMKIGFNINGKPKIIGSDIPKKAGTIPTFPTVLICLDLERTSKIAKAKQDPHPPITTKYTQKGVVKILGKASPATCAAAFKDRPPSRIGLKIPDKAAS